MAEEEKEVEPSAWKKTRADPGRERLQVGGNKELWLAQCPGACMRRSEQVQLKQLKQRAALCGPRHLERSSSFSGVCKVKRGSLFVSCLYVQLHVLGAIPPSPHT